jgi:broad specificity phosphatase PhoE
MRKLILIRHSNSKLDPDLPPHHWGLIQDGRDRCLLLVEKLSTQQPDIIFTSIEPKAVQTGEIVAQNLNLPCVVAPSLHEHERERGPIVGRAEFLARIANLFSNPDQLVLGRETANQALKRFSAAVEVLMAANPAQNVAIVTHGTVMSLYYAHLSGENVFPFWQSLGLPAFYVVAWPERQVISRELQIS